MNNLAKIKLRMVTDSAFRKALCRKSFYWFFHTYFPHYATYPTADFQKEIIDMLENDSQQMIAFTAFRGSGKSTISTLAYPIWSTIGSPRKQYILLISQTQNLCKQILTNIKQEFENNELLIKDFGPFNNKDDDWRANSLVIYQYDTRITAISSNESTRGLRHAQYRPDLLIADDVEDLELVKNKENRDNLWNRLTSEMIPIGDTNTKYVIVGNLLHEDSLMMRIKQAIHEGTMKGIYREYPLINDEGTNLWPSKFPTQKEIAILKSKAPNETAWFREYLLKFIADDERIIHRDQIHYYKELPDITFNPPRLIAVGVDLAISEKNTADYTSFVPIYVTGFGVKLKSYVLPYIFNKRVSFPETLAELKKLNLQLHDLFKLYPVFYVESTAYQLAMAQMLIVENLLAVPVNIGRLDKRERLSIVAPYISQGKILFSEHGVEELLSQTVNFGIEKHDDTTDAFTAAVLKIIEGDQPASQHFPEPSKPAPIYKKGPDGIIDVSKSIFSGVRTKVF